MTAREPVVGTVEVPYCFGLHHELGASRCRTCDYATECAEIVARWEPRLSLARAVCECEQSLETASSASVEDIYARVYREFFGRLPRHGASTVHKRAFDYVREVTADGSVDVETYIAGNMWALQEFASKNRYGFQPMMLQGERAMRRYSAYLGRLARRYRHAKHSGHTTGTERGDMRRMLFESEHEVGEWYTASVVAGRAVTFEQAIEHVAPSDVWIALQSKGQSKAYARACLIFGSANVQAEKRLASLRAAEAVANSYESGLADRVGVQRFDWHSFALLVKRLIAPVMVERATAPVDHWVEKWRR